MHKEIEKIIKQKTIPDMLNEILTVCDYMEEDGFIAYHIRKAIEASQMGNDTTKLHKYLTGYQRDFMKCSTNKQDKNTRERLEIYINIINQNVLYIDYKREHNL